MCIKDIADTITMTRFIIFATLMATLFANGISENEKVIVDLVHGSYMNLITNVEANECILKTNIGEEYTYNTSTYMIRDDIKPIRRRRYGDCSIVVDPMKLEHTGNWTITSYFNHESTSQTFTVYMGQKVEVIPNTYNTDINVIEGNFVYVELDADLENLTSCEAIARNGTRIDLLTVNRDDFRRYGECGFSAMLQRGDSGNWNLKATIDDKVIYTGYLRINVYEESNEYNGMKDIRLKRGYRGELNVRINARIISCQLTDPSGVIHPVTIGSCKHTIPVVTIRDEGIWTANYSVRGKVDLSNVSFNVITYESQTIESNVTRMENGDIQLQCHVYNEDWDSLVSCQFITPNGQVLNLFPGVGSKHYRAFNISGQRRWSRDYNCGVIILSPILDEDIGIWKCIINFDTNSAAVSAIRVDSSLLDGYETQNFTIDAKSVYAKQSESFQITCIADAPLNYCWFRSPNETMYSVSQKQPQTLFSLPYRGSGLSLGECGVEIDHAEFTDQGQWTCNLGIVNGPEEHKSFSVNIVDSYVIPGQSQVFAHEGGFVNLSCSILPSVTDRAVHYCRWVRPDGYGIRESHRYRTSHTNTQCELIIPEIRKYEDIGKWTCVAGLQGVIDEEAWTTITVIGLPPLIRAKQSSVRFSVRPDDSIAVPVPRP